MNLRVCRIGLAPAARFGFVTGAATAAPVGIIIAGVVHIVVSSLRRLLENWQHVSLGPGQPQANLISALKLSDALVTLQRLDDLPLIVVASVFVIVVLVGGLFAAVTAGWQAFVYNVITTLSGGLIVEVEPAGKDKMIVLRGDKRQK